MQFVKNRFKQHFQNFDIIYKLHYAINIKANFRIYKNLCFQLNFLILQSLTNIKIKNSYFARLILNDKASSGNNLYF